MTDIGGAVTNFRTYYGVLTYNDGPVEVSAGFAKRSGRAELALALGWSLCGRSVDARAVDPWPARVQRWRSLGRRTPVRTQGVGTRGMDRVCGRQPAPDGHAPDAEVVVHSGNLDSLVQGAGPARQPCQGTAALAFRHPTARPGLRGPHPCAGGHSRNGVTAPAAAPVPVPVAATPEQLDAVAAELQAKGLEDIWVGVMPDGSVALRANNASYNWNSADAVGAALGAIARTLGDSPIAYRLV